jgi:hypothetical protein
MKLKFTSQDKEEKEKNNNQKKHATLNLFLPLIFKFINLIVFINFVFTLSKWSKITFSSSKWTLYQKMVQNARHVSSTANNKGNFYIQTRI